MKQQTHTGNAVEKSFNIVVVGPVTDDENTQPVITVPTTPIEVEATSNAGEKVSYNVTAFDAEDGSLIPHCDPLSGSIFEIGQSIVKCTVMDNEGTVASTDFPVIVQPPPQVVEERACTAFNSHSISHNSCSHSCCHNYNTNKAKKKERYRY